MPEDLLNVSSGRNYCYSYFTSIAGDYAHEDMYNSFMKDMGVNLTGITKDKLPTIPMMLQ